jgi:dUTP pyrophosphatase
MRFEKVSKYKDVEIEMPKRKTIDSAGYDMVVAEDIIIPSSQSLYTLMAIVDKELYDVSDIFNVFFDPKNEPKKKEPKSLEDMAMITKTTGAKPTLVPTGMKCYLDPNTYLELSVRSSCPLKYWLLLANGVGIIDRDYVDNKDNEGEIFF